VQRQQGGQAHALLLVAEGAQQARAVAWVAKLAEAAQRHLQLLDRRPLVQPCPRPGRGMARVAMHQQADQPLAARVRRAGQHDQ